MQPEEVQNGWGWWSVFESLDKFEADVEKMVPNPGKYRLIEINKEYTPTELRDLLQHFGSYLANLNHLEATLEAQCHALSESYKNGMSVAISRSESKANTISIKEAEILANNEMFKQTKRMQIDHESMLLLIKGWKKSYEHAWSTVSRLITLELGESSLASGRYS